ncbi:MAG: pyruvate kinase [Candidatus Bathyarchaeota archaeon]|nr:pyruvate kinase [Candidatus Bathyarchaeota archaeon]
MKKTKIVCTIGPATSSKQMIQKMYAAGMNGARINTAYGDLDTYKSIIEAVRENTDVPVIVDIKGPEIRIKASQDKAISKGDILEVGFNGGDISFNHDFYDKMNVDDVVYIDNGKIRTKVVEKNNRKLRLLSRGSGTIEDGKGVNIPNKHLAVPTFSEKDLEIIELSKKLDVEYIALSFARNAEDVENLRSRTENNEIGIIAKIENFEGVENFEEILNAADGIMVARGDLGVEIKPEKVPLIQKSIIKKCNQQGKPVITATEMLESMVHQPSPTRAEVSDVANAILDGSDAVMLSGETAVGKYPVEAVQMMSRIARETENSAKSHVEEGAYVNVSDTISKAIQRICQSMPIDKVVTVTRSGYTAQVIARFRIAQPIIAVTADEKVRRQLELVFGAHPVRIDYREAKDRIAFVANRLHEMKLVDNEDVVLFTAGVRTQMPHASNSIEIHKISELRKFTTTL